MAPTNTAIPTPIRIASVGTWLPWISANGVATSVSFLSFATFFKMASVSLPISAFKCFSNSFALKGFAFSGTLLFSEILVSFVTSFFVFNAAVSGRSAGAGVSPGLSFFGASSGGAGVAPGFFRDFFLRFQCCRLG